MLTQNHLDIDAPIAIKIFKTRVTLVNQVTGDEQSFTVATVSDRFGPVLKAIQQEKRDRNLAGYEIFEALPIA